MFTRRSSLAFLFFAALPLWPSPSLASGKRVAVLPAHVFSGGSASGPRVTEALRADLQKHDFALVPQEAVERNLKSRKVDLSYPQSDRRLAEVAAELGVDFLVYPRVLGVGALLGARTPEAVILVNVLDRRTGKFFHTRQIGQEFETTATAQRDMVITTEAAARAAARLLESFYQKAAERR